MSVIEKLEKLRDRWDGNEYKMLDLAISIVKEDVERYAPDKKLRELKEFVNEWMLSEDEKIIDATPEFVNIKARHKKEFSKEFRGPQRKGLLGYAFEDVYGISEGVALGKKILKKIGDLENDS